MNIAEYIYQRRAKSVEPEWIAEILGRLSWLMDDNGSEIHQALERWLASGSHEQAMIALSYDDTFPYRTREEMIEGFSRLQSRFPDLKARCDEIVLRWDQQFSSSVS